MTRLNNMTRLNKLDLIIAAGAFNAFIAVAAGAFAAHGLKNVLSSDYLAVFRTAADYQMMHGIGLILIGVLNKQSANRRNMTAALFMLSGIILFSGSLYVLATTGIKWLGMITPFGGACFLIAWLILAFNYLRNREHKENKENKD
jgi:uncharacterized membrane protein YgdD (TMEM256/DUF423 family)